MSVMSADLLRRAADKIRETASAATPGPWEQEGSSIAAGEFIILDALPDDGTGTWTKQAADVAHVALWSPDVAELVASMLDGAVVRYASLTTDDIEMRAYGLDPRQAEEALHREFALARRILGEGA